MRRSPLPLILALVLPACSDWIVDPFEYGMIEVEVVRPSGEPIPGVELVIFTRGRRMAWGGTDDMGRHRFEFVTPGGWGVRAIPPEGFVGSWIVTGERPVKRVQMEEGAQRSLEFTLLKPGSGSVDVAVSDAVGNPVPGAEITLFGISRGFEGTAVTGPEGAAIFGPVGTGLYGVRVRAPPGFETPDGTQEAETDGFLVDADFRAEVSFELRRTS